MTTVLTTATVPLEIHGHGGGGSVFLDPLLGFGGLLLVIALVLLGLVLLRRYGVIPDNLTLGRRCWPEEGARQLLAERLAKGEVSTEEFMERASVLNWTPGSDLNPPTRRFRRHK